MISNLRLVVKLWESGTSGTKKAAIKAAFFVAPFPKCSQIVPNLEKPWIKPFRNRRLDGADEENRNRHKILSYNDAKSNANRINVLTTVLKIRPCHP